jgi:hypothetical protein
MGYIEHGKVGCFSGLTLARLREHLPSPGLFSLVSKAHTTGFLVSELVDPSGMRA